MMNTNHARTEPTVNIPAGYRQMIRFGAIWTMVTSPYMILYLLVALTIGQLANQSSLSQVLEAAGKRPFAFSTPVLLDGFSHVLFFVTFVTLFAALRTRWPVFASLILVFGAWQMFIGFTKALNTFITFNTLGQAYVSGDAAARQGLLFAAMASDGLRQALQWMDSLGVMAVWILVSLLPAAAGIPRPVRWLGWILSLAILAPDPAFLLVVLLFPVWQFLLGRWLKRQAAPVQIIAPVTSLESHPLQ
jgi:hypothetical protein